MLLLNNVTRPWRKTAGGTVVMKLEASAGQSCVAATLLHAAVPERRLPLGRPSPSVRKDSATVLDESEVEQVCFAPPEKDDSLAGHVECVLHASHLQHPAEGCVAAAVLSWRGRRLPESTVSVRA